MLDGFSIPYSAHAEVGERAKTIADAARRLRCDHIVMSTARKNSLTRLVENSVTNKVIELTAVPVEVIAGDSVSKLERYGIPAAIAPQSPCSWRLQTDAKLAVLRVDDDADTRRAGGATGCVEKRLGVLAEPPFTQQVSERVWELKILLLVLIFVYAFFKFSWLIRRASRGASRMPLPLRSISARQHVAWLAVHEHFYYGAATTTRLRPLPSHDTARRRHD